jgi:hypothetical protein
MPGGALVLDGVRVVGVQFCVHVRNHSCPVVVRQWCLSRDLILSRDDEVPALSYSPGRPPRRDGHIGCRLGRMHNAIVLLALGLLAMLLGSVWLRRTELEFNGESRTMVLGLAVCLLSVLLILFAAT